MTNGPRTGWTEEATLHTDTCHGTAGEPIPRAPETTVPSSRPPRTPSFRLLLYFTNVTSYSPKARAHLMARTEPLVAAAETHLGPGEFLPLANGHYRRWPRCAIATATPTAKGGTQGGIFMGAAKAAKADPSATCVFTPSQGAHVSPHRDATYFWASISNRRILIGSAYAREGNILRIAHSLSIETNGNPSTDFIIAADWNDSPERTVAIFADLLIPVAAVTPDGPTCLTDDSSSTIDFLITSVSLAPCLKVQRDLLCPWSPHLGLIVEIRAHLDSPAYNTLHKPKPLRQALLKHPFDNPKLTWDQAKSRTANFQSRPLSSFPGYEFVKNFTGHAPHARRLTDNHCWFTAALEQYQLGRTCLQTGHDKRPYTGRAQPPS